MHTLCHEIQNAIINECENGYILTGKVDINEEQAGYYFEYTVKVNKEDIDVMMYKKKKLHRTLTKYKQVLYFSKFSCPVTNVNVNTINKLFYDNMNRTIFKGNKSEVIESINNFVDKFVVVEK